VDNRNDGGYLGPAPLLNGRTGTVIARPFAQPIMFCRFVTAAFGRPWRASHTLPGVDRSPREGGMHHCIKAEVIDLGFKKETTDESPEFMKAAMSFWNFPD
jgi:hypothetical protein